MEPHDDLSYAISHKNSILSILNVYNTPLFFFLFGNTSDQVKVMLTERRSLLTLTTVHTNTAHGKLLSYNTFTIIYYVQTLFYIIAIYICLNSNSEFLDLNRA